MTSAPIGDHAFLSDCRSAVIVSPGGSVDWWCLPRFDSPSVFGRLLDPAAGHWSLAPAVAHERRRSYLADTLVLTTRCTCGDAEAEVTEALTFEPGARGHDIGLRSPGVLVRRIRGVRGSIPFETVFAPRFEYGRTTARLRREGRAVEAAAGPVTLRLEASVELDCRVEEAVAVFTVSAGETVELRLSYGPTYGARPPDVSAGTALLEDTVEGWRSWASLHPGVEGAYADVIRHSAVVLQGLTYAPSGAVLAAATTSLPEALGQDRNWDYRFAWLRDVSLTMRALWVGSCPDEADHFFRWIARSAGTFDGDEPVQIMFGVEGERDLSERTLEHLAGYAGSRPVRVGNEAWRQRQLDVTGEVLDAAVLLRDQLDLDDAEVGRLLVDLADRAAADWGRPDAGMWEARDAERHYLTSKVLCWVALDRAVELAADLAVDGATVQRWTAVRDEIRTSVLERGWDEQVGAYTGAFGSPDIDASVLLLPLVGFVDATDPRMRSTIDVVERRLGVGQVVRRWAAEDAGFFLCSFWLVECLVLAGEVERARAWFDRTVGFAGELGLFAEQMDAASGDQLGNYPQAFSHVGLVNAAWRLTQADGRG